MIEMVETPHGLMPRKVVERIAKRKAEQKAKAHEAIDAAGEQRAHAAGVSMADIKALRRTPLETLHRAAKKVREQHTAATLETAYPCRSCRVVTDEKYFEACHLLGRMPCFLAESMRGCSSWQPQQIKGYMPVDLKGGVLVRGPAPKPAGSVLISPDLGRKA